MIEKFLIAVYDNFIAPWFEPSTFLIKVSLCGGIIAMLILIIISKKFNKKNKIYLSILTIIGGLVLFGIIYLLKLFVGGALSIGFTILLFIIVAIFCFLSRLN